MPGDGGAAARFLQGANEDFPDLRGDAGDPYFRHGRGPGERHERSGDSRSSC